jgi:hypothetical protein
MWSVVRASILVGLVSVLVACGGGNRPNAMKDTPSPLAKEALALLSHATHEEWTLGATFDPPRPLPGFEQLVPPRSFVEKYGPLRLDVVHNDRIVPGTNLDKQLRWTYSPHEVPGVPEFWIGAKRYGDISLQMRRNSRDAGAAWPELDELLTRLFASQ